MISQEIRRQNRLSRDSQTSERRVKTKQNAFLYNVHIKSRKIILSFVYSVPCETKYLVV